MEKDRPSLDIMHPISTLRSIGAWALTEVAELILFMEANDREAPRHSPEFRQD